MATIMPRRPARPGSNPPAVARTAVANVSSGLYRKEVPLGEVKRRDLPVEEVLSTEPMGELGFSVGQTINTGDYNSLRIDVSLKFPTTEEDIRDTFEKASQLANELLAQERAAWLGEGN